VVEVEIEVLAGAVELAEAPGQLVDSLLAAELVVEPGAVAESGAVVVEALKADLDP